MDSDNDDNIIIQKIGLNELDDELNELNYVSDSDNYSGGFSTDSKQVNMYDSDNKSDDDKTDIDNINGGNDSDVEYNGGFSTDSDVDISDSDAVSDIDGGGKKSKTIKNKTKKINKKNSKSETDNSDSDVPDDDEYDENSEEYDNEEYEDDEEDEETYGDNVFNDDIDAILPFCIINNDKKEITITENDEKLTSELLSITELTALLCERVVLIEKLAPAMVQTNINDRPIYIAIRELNEHKFPLLLMRKRNTVCELWDPNEMSYDINKLPFESKEILQIN